MEGRTEWDMLANLLEMAAFTKTPKVLWGQPLDAFRSNTQSIKSLVGGCANGDVLSLQCYFAFIPTKQLEGIHKWRNAVSYKDAYGADSINEPIMSPMLVGTGTRLV